MKKNLVSIVTPCYNAGKFIGQTIDSVLAQTHTHWELIIVDDCSSDSSVEIIERYTYRDNRIKLIRQPENGGAVLARNKAIEEACGQYIAFLDADDLWLPNKLEKQLVFMREHDLAFTYSSYQLMNESGEYLGEFLTQPQISYHFLLKTNCIGCLTAIYDVEKIKSKLRPETFFIVDGSQSFPNMPIDVQKIGCDCFVLTGHKAMSYTGI